MHAGEKESRELKREGRTRSRRNDNDAARRRHGRRRRRDGQHGRVGREGRRRGGRRRRCHGRGVAVGLGCDQAFEGWEEKRGPHLVFVGLS